jgi:hypothetical protein
VSEPVEDKVGAIETIINWALAQKIKILILWKNKLTKYKQSLIATVKNCRRYMVTYNQIVSDSLRANGM